MTPSATARRRSSGPRHARLLKQAEQAAQAQAQAAWNNFLSMFLASLFFPSGDGGDPQPAQNTAQQQTASASNWLKPDHFTFDPTLPASVKVVGQAGSLNGAPDANHPMPGVAAVNGNLFKEQVVGLTGRPAQGNFTTTEHIQPMVGNIHSPSMTSGALHEANTPRRSPTARSPGP